MMNPEHVIAIDAMLNGAEDLVTYNECCIYRVPFRLRRLNEDAYTPKVVSIGPFHHNTHPHLRNMERYKLSYCKYFLQQRTRTTSDTWIQYIQSVEPQIRSCYSETLPFTEEELVNIIFVDSGFILELFCRYYDGNWSDGEVCLSTPWLRASIRGDMLLLENQVPFFVLDHLFNLSISASADDNNISISFIDLPLDYFDYYNTSKLSFDNISILHFTDLLRMFYPPPSPNIDVDEPETQHPSTASLCLETCLKDEKRKFCTFQCTGGKVTRVLEWVERGFKCMNLKIKHTPSCQRKERRKLDTETQLPSATELSEAGVKFEVNNNENMCLLDLKFKKPVLKIPQLVVEDRTEMLFRNMVALEQCHYHKESYITEYVQIMDYLVNTSRDVDILVRKGILINQLGDAESVANMFNGLCKNIVLNITGYSLLYRDLNAFHRNRWNNLKSTLRHDYCKTPWQTAATFAAILLLILTVGQTVCSVLQRVSNSATYRPHRAFNGRAIIAPDVYFLTQQTELDFVNYTGIYHKNTKIVETKGRREEFRGEETILTQNS
ncbi:hypothetical protein Fmac_000784 [Flemingia macrophylla]|uniref:Envelope protein n=1 Tax=Flemingia macrophylla TaxID=520843 RepID=A0ABD1NFA1_9FABA